MRKGSIWVLWVAVIAGLSVYLFHALNSNDETRKIYLVGKMTDGHAQFGMQCSSCHTKAFGDKDDMQKACVRCHGKELKVADDSHPESKFTDPRNAEVVAKLDARYCVTCHTEHKPRATNVMGVTLPKDFCVTCHKDIGKERATHKNLAFNTCQNSGCHNFHDNRALYEDFLAKHAAKGAMLATQKLPGKNFLERYKISFKKPVKPILVGQSNAPREQKEKHGVPPGWHQTKHARAGVNCMSCHGDNKSGKNWIAKPGHKVCATCHRKEQEGFLAGKHGIRIALKLPAMTPGKARIPMHPRASHKKLGCNSCHQAHKDDTRHAAVKACMSCHNSQHVLAYKKSPHFRLWQKEVQGKAKKGTGVSCASCHMPRSQEKVDGKMLTFVQHNQNDNLRPNEKMIRSVCMSCHGVRFSINALASRKLIRNNFRGKPEKKIKSVDWSSQRDKKKKKGSRNSIF